jgi:glutaminase
MDGGPIAAVLGRLHRELRQLDGGAVATYIPELGRANPEHFAICVATTDGRVYRAGDADVGFTIQSISKPFVYGLALDDNGMDAVMARVGVEPSGEAFNAISLEPATGRPRNPMINAGAIAIAGMIRGATSEERFRRMLRMLSAYAGRPLPVDESVYRSERDTGHRNRAIGHLLRNAGILERDVDEVVNRYFRQCAVQVTCEDLAMMGATLANGGINPLTGDRASERESVGRVLSVMSTCGMYDATGAWVYRVGMPAKSGVAGGILAVLPGQLGIGVFSPKLDEFGNSVRGVAACEALSKAFALHLLQPPLALANVVRGTFRLPELSSRRKRSPLELATLDEHGGRVRVYQLQGPLVLSTAELVLRRAAEGLAAEQMVVLDFRRVTTLDESVAPLFGLFAAEVAAQAGRCFFAHVARSDAWAERVLEVAGAGAGEVTHFVDDLDLALEVCEEALLAEHCIRPEVARELDPADHSLLQGLAPDEARAMAAILVRRSFAAGERIVRRGEQGDAVYLIAAGTAQVAIDAGGGRRHRLASLGAGLVFGELALMSEGPRSADVYAETAVTCDVFRVADLARLDADFPYLRLRLIEAVALDLSDRLRRANSEIAALAT